MNELTNINIINTINDMHALTLSLKQLTQHPLVTNDLMGC